MNKVHFPKFWRLSEYLDFTVVKTIFENGKRPPAFIIDKLLFIQISELPASGMEAFEDGRIDTEVISRDDANWVFDLPEKEQSYFKFMECPLEHSREKN